MINSYEDTCEFEREKKHRTIDSDQYFLMLFEYSTNDASFRNGNWSNLELSGMQVGIYNIY